MRKCVIVMNPESGKVKKLESFKNFYDILRKYGYDAEIKLTKAKKHATQIVKDLDDDIDLVISAGGDGTLNEVVTGNNEREKKLPLANLPMGTTNDVGSMYGFSRNVYKNLELLLDGKQEKIDICYINETPFVYVACLGDYIDMAYNTPRELKKKYGKLAYAMHAVKQLGNQLNTYNVKYEIDGETHEGIYSFFFISNSSRIAGVSDIYYDVKLNDNMFEVALAKAKSKKELVKTIIQMTTMEIKDVPGIEYYQTNNFKIEFITDPKVSWCIDGEEYKSESKTFEFKVRQNMKMLLPKQNIKKLFEEVEEQE